MTELNERQRRFVDEYLVDLNATQAAIRAGYSEKTSYSQAHDLLKKPEIQARIAELRAAQVERTQLDADYVLAGLRREAETGLHSGEPNTARIRALELIGKHQGMFVDRAEVGAPGDFTGLSDEELRERVAAKLKQIDGGRRE